jgi:hypothetical protein
MRIACAEHVKKTAFVFALCSEETGRDDGASGIANGQLSRLRTRVNHRTTKFNLCLDTCSKLITGFNFKEKATVGLVDKTKEPFGCADKSAEKY